MSNETGKCKKANQCLKAVGTQVEAVEKRMIEAYNILVSICPEGNEVVADVKIVDLERIKVSHAGLDFHIKFCLVSDDDDIEGAIIYSALRKPSYPQTLKPNPEGKKEEKPLLSFSVDDLGKISSEGKLEDEWWLTGNGKDVHAAVEEMHYRALNLIWHDALNWVNEPLLP